MECTSFDYINGIVASSHTILRCNIWGDTNKTLLMRLSNAGWNKFLIKYIGLTFCTTVTSPPKDQSLKRIFWRRGPSLYWGGIWRGAAILEAKTHKWKFFRGNKIFSDEKFWGEARPYFGGYLVVLVWGGGTVGSINAKSSCYFTMTLSFLFDSETLKPIHANSGATRFKRRRQTNSGGGHRIGPLLDMMEKETVTTLWKRLPYVKNHFLRLMRQMICMTRGYHGNYWKIITMS